MSNTEHEKEVEAIEDVSSTETVETVEEETVASSTLKPAARSVSDDKALTDSKVQMMKQVLHMMGGMDKEDCTEWFTKAMAVFGPGKDHGVGDVASKNSDSIDTTLGKGPKTEYPMPKIANITPGQAVREDVEDMLSGEDLSEEFKEKATTIFEAAVAARISTEIARLEEEYENALNEELASVSEEIEAKLDTYLDYAAENFMKENEVAIESALRNEIMEDFINGLKGLFTEHYIELPEEKIDVLEALTEKVEALELKLNEEIEKNSELEATILEETRMDILENIASDLVLTQQEKFRALAEGIEFSGDLEVYEKKLKIVKENYFNKPTTHKTNITEETFEGDIEANKSVSSDPQVNRYVQALSRTVKH